MAIFAEITFRKLSAEVSSRKLVAESQTVGFSSSVIFSKKITFFANYQNLSLSDITLEVNPVVSLLNNEFSFNDSQTFHTTSAQADNVNFSDTQVFETTKSSSDSFAIQQQIFLQPEKVAVDTLTISDSHLFDVTSAPQSVLSLSENIHLEMHFVKDFTDSFATSDSVLALHSILNKTDSFSLLENAIFNVQASLADNFSMSDPISIGVLKPGVSDSFSLSESVSPVLVSHSSLFNTALMGNILLNEQ